MRMRLSASTAVERAAQPRISTEAARGPAAGSARCKHCGLSVPGERRSSAFCCAGCEAVHDLLQQDGLEQFYRLGGASLGAVGAVPRTVQLDWLPEYEQRHGLADGSVCLSLDVQGIRCAACVWLLQEVWRKQPGARSLRLDASLGRATLIYDPALGTGNAFLARAARLGYPMAPPRRRVERDTGLLVRLGICAALAMNAMILAVAQYCGLAAAAPRIDAVFGQVAFALATASVLVGGPVFFRAAVAGLRAGVVHMDLPISLGLLLAYGGSIYGHRTGGVVYFDTVAMFVALMLGGRFLQQRTLQRGRDQVLADDGAEHLRVRRLDQGRVEVVPIAAVRAGDELVLAPGDLVPVRARLCAAASCSLDWTNGESEPRAFAAGDTVTAGAFVAGRRAVRMIAVADYQESGLAELLAQSPVDREDPQRRLRFWTRWARSYSTAVLGIAALGGLAWLWIDPRQSLPVAIAVLVVTCPCAIGVAQPLSFHLALARLRRHGVFVRTRLLLDKLARVRKVVFDKTGTLTFGGLRATVLQSTPPDAAPLLATLAASSNHPASQAVLASLDGAAVFAADVDTEETPGGGVHAVHAGRDYRLGSARFVTGTAGNGARECVFGRDGEVLARFRLDEDYREGVAAEFGDLHRRGLDVHILSGDREDRVRQAAATLGLAAERAHGGMTPAQKADFVRALDAGDTLMIGDGLNDAPAFGEAFCAGTPAMDRPVLPARADFFFRGAAAGAVERTLATAALYRAVVRTNMAMALTYNVLVLALALTGNVTPLLCAVLMPLSSLVLVVHTSWRLSRRGGR